MGAPTPPTSFVGLRRPHSFGECGYLLSPGHAGRHRLTPVDLLVHAAVAPTVSRMFFVMLGVGVGLAVAVGPLGWLSGLVDLICAGLVQLALAGVDTVLATLPAGVAESSLTAALRIGLAVTMPGVVCLALVSAAKGARKIRQVVAAVLLLAGAASFLVLPFQTAVAVCAAAGALASLLATVTGVALTAPLAGLATAFAVSQVRAVFAGASKAVNDGAAELAVLSGTGDASLWRLVLVVVAVAPFVFAFNTLLLKR